MKSYPVLKLQGLMQSWGDHTCEDLRSTYSFPTHSALVGIFGAAFGIKRTEHARLQAVCSGFRYAVREDVRFRETEDWFGDKKQVPCRSYVLTDYHTIQPGKSRTASGKIRKKGIVTHRQYICEACFTVVLELLDGCPFNIRELRHALSHPEYPIYLGRLCCLPVRPLYETVVKAQDILTAINAVPPGGDLVYCDVEKDSITKLRIRDIPVFGESRTSYYSRDVFVHKGRIHESFSEQSDPQEASSA